MSVRHGITYLVVCIIVVPLGLAAAGEKPIYQDPHVAEKLKSGDTAARKAILRAIGWVLSIYGSSGR